MDGLPETMIVIYGLREIDSEQIRYIGQTKLPLKERLQLWKSNARRGGDRPVFVWIRSVFEKIDIVQIETTQDPNDRERFWISHLRTQLLNVATGGPGCPGVIPDMKTRSKRANSVKKNWKKQKIRRRFFISDKQRIKQSDGLKIAWARRKANA